MANGSVLPKTARLNITTIKFASSDLANTLQERVDISVANGLKKVYIGKPYSLAFKVGEPVLVYRKYTGTGGRPGYKSVITTYCVATRIEKIKVNGRAQYSYDQFLRMVGSKSVYNEDELKERYDTWASLTLIELLAGITKKFYFSYYSGKDKAIAYKLKNVVIYEKPKAFSDYGIRQAPQSFVYL